MLTDIIGFDDLDLVIDLLNRREKFRDQSKAFPKDEILGRLQTRAQREEALRQQDLEHKTASLPSAVDRDEVQYPHVYKSHEAGNFVSTSGKSYALPYGTKKTDNEVRISPLEPWIFAHHPRNTRNIRFPLPKWERLGKTKVL